MKREDYYIQEALKYAESETLNAEALAFIAGMKMADTHPNWIKVEDRLPDEYKDVLVFCPFGFIDNLYVAHVDGIDFFTSDGAWVRPTHWMPIFLPKED